MKSKDFSLVPSKYIEFINRDENIDFEEKMATLQSEFADLLKAEEQSKADLLKVFEELGYKISLEPWLIRIIRLLDYEIRRFDI